MISFLTKSYWKSEMAVDLGTSVIRVSSGMYANFVHQSHINGHPALCSGVVSDRAAVVGILRRLLSKARGSGLLKPRAIVCAPSDATNDELETIRDCVSRAGIFSTIIVPEPLAAAIGAGVDVSSPYANIILDIGEGVTDCALIKEGRLYRTHAVRIGCEDLRKVVVSAIWEHCGIRIMSGTAERILRDIGVLYFSTPNNFFEQKEHGVGSQLLPAGISLNAIRTGMVPILDKMLGGIVELFHEITPDVSCELIENGIHLTGGGALLKGLRELVESKTHIDVIAVHNPLDAVITGAREMLPVASLLNRWEKCR